MKNDSSVIIYTKLILNLSISYVEKKRISEDGDLCNALKEKHKILHTANVPYSEYFM